MVKNLSVVPETRVRSLGWEDPLEEGMATQIIETFSSTEIALKIK